MNKDPYSVLGISPGASDDEVKKAYKELVKKYHPDQYQGNPLSDVAEEKMAEINTAYDEIMTSRRSGGNSYNYGYSDGGYSSRGNDFSNIRMMIQQGNISNAEMILDGMPDNMRGAEWHFLKGSVCYSRGWLGEAASYFNTAARMEPGNAEYSAAANRMNQNSSGFMNGAQNVYGAPRYNTRSQNDQCCDGLSTLCCLDCCCEMMGGDLIPCC
ncbi:MAG: J domain-containing protein [Ruminococcus sp.]|nr:J domain-containing protein [Ruminococcus sp.]